MDCFYAAVEMRDFPQYQNVPIAVGFDGERSVVCTANYLARQYGVRSAMAVKKAKQLCAPLQIVNARMAVYKAVSKHIREIFLRYTDQIEPLSLDEAFLDVTNCKLCHGSATLIAEEIRNAIFNELNLTASAGVAPNKFLAKIASDENKPDGICVVAPDQVINFVQHMPLNKIPGIGPKTAAKLANYQLYTCADVRAASIKQLLPIVGSFAPSLYQRSFGIDERDVITERERKSLGVEKTFAADFNELSECQKIVPTLFATLSERLSLCEHGSIIKQGVKLKFADFNQTTVEQQSTDCELNTFTDLLTTAYQRANGRAIRLIGLQLGFKKNIESEERQLSLAL